MAVMPLMAPLACVALFSGASALTFQVQSEQSGRLMREDCHTAVAGDFCYTHVHWVMTRGIKYHAKEFPNTLSASSSFEDVQAYLHTLDKLKGICAIPCAAASGEKVTAEDGKRPQAGAAEVDEVASERAASPEAVAKEDEPLLEDSGDSRNGADVEKASAPVNAAEQEETPPGIAPAEPPQMLAPQESAPEQQMRAPILPPAPEVPSEKGCYVWKPSGCPRQNQPADGSGWKPDITVTHEAAATTEMACMARKAPFDKYCGTTSTKMVWIPPPAPEVPSEKGCYVWKPSGCPKQNQPADGSGWKLDVTKTHEAAATSETACMARKAQFNKYCGTTSIKMIYVS